MRLMKNGLAVLAALALSSCGVPQENVSETKIVGGEDVPAGQSDLRAKATIALTTDLGPEGEGGPLDNGRSFCSGTVISDEVILTAAHCVEKFDPQTREKAGELLFPYERDFIVFFGNKVSRDGTWIRAKHVIPNPDWSPKETLSPQPGRSPDDIAVIVLESKIPAEAAVAPIAPADTDLSSLQAHLVGFGVSKSRNNNDTGTKRQVSVSVSKQDNPIKRFTVGELFRGACAGDSGGPAYFEINGQLHVAGATSTGAEIFGMCLGMGNNYTDARQYSNWIESEVGAFL